MRQERWDAFPQEQQEKFAPLCPDFVIELRSRSDSLKALQEKMREYLENGARLGWLIDRHNQRIEIYRPGKAAETVQSPQSISGEDVLPEFSLNLQEIL